MDSRVLLAWPEVEAAALAEPVVVIRVHQEGPEILAEGEAEVVGEGAEVGYPMRGFERNSVSSKSECVVSSRR